LSKFARSIGEEKWEEVRERVGRGRPDLLEELKDVVTLSLEDYRSRAEDL